MMSRLFRTSAGVLVLLAMAGTLTSPVAALARPVAGETWVARYNGPASQLDSADAVAASPDGRRVYVTGQSPGVSSGDDVATIAYDAATGTELWEQRYDGGASGLDGGAAIVVSPDGSRVYVTGGTATTAEGRDFTTLAYDAVTGSPLWIRNYNGPANGDDGATAIGVSPDGGTVVVTGISYGGATSNDYATVAYDAVDGSPLWVQRFDGPGHGPNGSTFVTGYAHMGSTKYDYLTMALSTSTGAVLWVKNYSRSSHSLDYAQALALSPDASRVFVTGSSTNGNRNEDFATIAMDAATGASIWVRLYDGPSHQMDEATDVLVSRDGSEVIVCGVSDGGASYLDYATVAFRSDTGSPIWVRRYDGSAHDTDFAFGLASSADGTFVYVTGYVSTAAGGTDYGTLAYLTSTGAVVGTRIYDGPAHGSDYGLAIATSSTEVFVTGQSDGGLATNIDYATVAYTI